VTVDDAARPANEAAPIGAGPESPDPSDEGALAVFRNRPFLLLWLSQLATQVGGNMVIFGLTVIIAKSTGSTSAVSALILTFLVPAVLFSAVAGVYVDRLDRRLVLVVTNVLRGAAFIAVFFVGDNLVGIYLLNIFISTVTVFFGPAEAAMIPMVVPRRQLLSANGVFTLTLNAAFALGFALVGPLVVKIAGPQALIILVAALYFVAAAFCSTLPMNPRSGPAVVTRATVVETEQAVAGVLWQLREGLSYIRAHREIRWSLIYLGIAASLVGVLGVLGPNFAQHTLGLGPEDFVVVVLPLGVGIVMGILLLNAYGRLLPRRRVIEGGLIALGAFLAAMALSGRISSFLGNTATRTGVDLSLLTSLLSIVVALAFFAGISYAAVAIPAQTQLQEDLPEDVRGRVFGVLNMLVSVASFLPILVVGPIADLAGTTIVLVVVAILIIASGLASIYLRGPLRAVERDSRATVGADRDPFVTALGVEARPNMEDFDGEPIAEAGAEAATAAPVPGAATPVGSVVAAAVNPITPMAEPVDPEGATERLPIGPRPEAGDALADADDAGSPGRDSSG
jgi:MFS family permease